MSEDSTIKYYSDRLLNNQEMWRKNMDSENYVYKRKQSGHYLIMVFDSFGLSGCI